MYIASTGTWKLYQDHAQLEIPPRNHTPLAALFSPNLFTIYLFYIDQADQLVATAVFPRGPLYGQNLLNESISVLVGSRSLSVSQTFEHGRGVSAILIYEGSNGGIMALRFPYRRTSDQIPWPWQNVTKAFSTLRRDSQKAILSPSKPLAASPSRPIVYFFDKPSSSEESHVFLQTAEISSPGLGMS